ncbi:cysteine proteinase [Setomelanomma holmii]|uniref:Cysteine proteinase n=1 Tax=Setomelanomma holmii TaxID=210430 RepID=A0A9P4GYV2_9PLEO|nr:cysteine proteinase [Setomelanomma holmii]
MPNDTTIETRRRRSPAKSVQVPNSDAKRKAIRKDGSEKGWQLMRARTHGFDSDSAEARGQLQLRKSDTEWEIGFHDSVNNMFDVRVTMNPEHLNKVVADEFSCIRLEGGRRQDGNCPTFDLVFDDARDFLIFRDHYAVSYTVQNRIFPSDHSDMVTKFSKCLPHNEKVGKTPLLDDLLPVKDDKARGDAVRSSDSSIWSRNAAARQEKDQPTNGNIISAAFRASRSLAQPARSTRSSAPTLDEVEEIKDREVEKYSVKHGLGPRWLQPLSYGEGRRWTNVIFDDLSRLDEEEFLNDNLIEFYMLYLFQQSRIPEDKVFFFNTYFFTRLTQDTGCGKSINYKAVERWTSKEDIFKYDYIVVPINQQTHWYLAIICNVDKIARTPIMVDFDEVDRVTVAKGDDGRLETNETIEPLITAGPQSIEAPQAITSPKQSTHEQPAEEQIEDVNLFNEESRLEVVDREATNIEEKAPTIAVADSLLAHFEEAAFAHAISAEPTPRTVLSNLNPSPVKKKTKRKPKGPRKDPNAPIIMILDSLPGNGRSGAVRALKDWIAAEGKKRRAMEAVIKENGYYPKADQIPIQSNFSDCGVYLLGYVEKFFEDPDSFKTKLLTGEMSADEDWPQLKPKEMRKNLRDIIFALAKEQKLTEKQKKGKKGASAKSSPAKTEAPPENPLPPTSPNKMRDASPRNGTTNTMVNKEATKSPESDSEERFAPQLASPFVFKIQGSPAKPNTGSMEATSEAHRSVSRSRSPVKSFAVSPHVQQTSKRRASPEVRVPVKISPSQALVSKNLHTVNGNAAANGTAHEGRKGAALSSPSEKMREDDQLHIPTSKKHTSDSSQTQWRHVSPRRSLQSPEGILEGRSDRPIEIADSQEFKPVVIQSPRRLELGASAQKRRPSRSPRKRQALNHAPSVEEIAPPPQVTQRKHRQPEKAAIGHRLESRLGEDEDDAARQRSGKARARAPSPSATFHTTRQHEPEPMEVDSQGVDPRGTADDVIRETPTPKRMSPGKTGDWVQGEALPT